MSLSSKYTKEELVTIHRNMWNWVTEQYRKGSFEPAVILKRIYVSTHSLELRGDCAGCEWSDFNCYKCLFAWPDNKSCVQDGTGLYDKCNYAWRKLVSGRTKDEEENRKELIEIAREIASLPVKED